MALINENIRFHLKTTGKDVGKYVILPGDPGRVEKIADYLENAKLIASNREFVTYTGFLGPEKVSVVSTGIGGPSAAIAVEELIKCGCHTFIRVGTCGGINTKVTGGDLVIVSAAVRAEGTSAEYLPDGYPAAADFDVVRALADSAKELGAPYHVGVAQSKDSFYGEVEPESMPVAPKLADKWAAYVKCGCLASEMEAAAVFAVALTRGVRAGAVLTALWNAERSRAGLPDAVAESGENAIKCAVSAVRKLAAIDEDKT